MTFVPAVSGITFRAIRGIVRRANRFCRANLRLSGRLRADFFSRSDQTASHGSNADNCKSRARLFLAAEMSGVLSIPAQAAMRPSASRKFLPHWDLLAAEFVRNQTPQGGYSSR
jgi:hypothetical protein